MAWALAAGDVLAHYRVVSPLGTGGMGQVYLAEDLRLGRRLALKVLTPRARREEDLLHRFEREARTVSALNHPNILTIYDVGQSGETHFIATEFIEGVTLRSVIAQGPLSIRRAVEIAMQVTQALSAAHGAGVVHRDLKPENVMIRADGYVKVLDFGLAKLVGADAWSAHPESPTQLADTNEGVVLGTFNYMAPEQARGGDLDARADVFALGILLHEMLVGEPPFKGPTAADVVGAVLFRDPDPVSSFVDAPPQVDRLVAACLQKNRDERLPSCAAVLAELRALARTLEWQDDSDRSPRIPSSVVSAASVAGDVRSSRRGSAIAPARPRKRSTRTIGSLAVLPFTNRGHDDDLEYLGDGLTESLINSLSQLPRLRVMARSTVFRYKGRYADPRAVGRDLQVQAVLMGHVSQRGTALTVSAELVNAEDGSQIWGTSVARATSDVSVVQGEISRELTSALRLRLTGEQKQRVGKRHTASAEAYQLYLRGRYFLNMRTGDALANARTLFEHAIAADDRYALAHAGLADCCALLAVSLRTHAVGALIEQARAAASRALELDDRLPDGHASMAFVKFRFDWEWDAAEQEFATALDLSPGHAPSRQWHAMFLASRARFEPALAEMSRALELDPLSLVIQSGIGRILHFAGRLDEAVRQYGHVLQTNPDFGQARVDLALTEMARGDLAAARDQLARAEQSLGAVSTIVLLRGCCAVREGNVDEGRAAFASLLDRYHAGSAGADDLALMAAVLGDGTPALAWLMEACARRSPFLGYVDVEPAMAALILDPDCREVLRRHGFTADPKGLRIPA
jgi:serine/threonine-protein kinase